MDQVKQQNQIQEDQLRAWRNRPETQWFIQQAALLLATKRHRFGKGGIRDEEGTTFLEGEISGIISVVRDIINLPDFDKTPGKHGKIPNARTK